MTFERQSQSYRTLYSRPQGHRVCVPQWPANKTIRFAAAAISWIGTRDYELSVDAVNKRAALFAFFCVSLAGGRVEKQPPHALRGFGPGVDAFCVVLVKLLGQLNVLALLLRPQSSEWY